MAGLGLEKLAAEPFGLLELPLVNEAGGGDKLGRQAGKPLGLLLRFALAGMTLQAGKGPPTAMEGRVQGDSAVESGNRLLGPTLVEP